MTRASRSVVDARAAVGCFAPRLPIVDRLDRRQLRQRLVDAGQRFGGGAALLRGL
jgi:hypothetical protein